jgi:hypothetical protein
MGDRAARWFYGLPNLVGIVLALVGLGLYIAGAISGWLVPLIVVGLYLIGAIVTPRPKGLAGLSTLSGDLDPDQLKADLDKIVTESQSRLPDDLAAKVVAIQATIVDVLPTLAASTIDRQDLFALERTVSDYLPQTLDNYLTLPRAYAHTHVVSNGKTAEQLLGDQLDLIAEKMKEISDAIAKDDVANLLAQGRFLEARFGKNSELSIPDETTADAAPAASPAPPTPPADGKAVAKR